MTCENSYETERITDTENRLVVAKEEGLGKGWNICYCLNFCIPQNSCVEILMPNVMILGDAAFES